MFRRSMTCLAAILVGLVLPVSTFALVQGEVIAGYSLGYDDNVGLNTASAGQEEDISNELYLDVSLLKSTGFFRYDIFGRSSFTAHSASQIEDQFSVSGGANALWLIVPNRLSWDISDIAEIRRRDSRSITSSSNTEQTNVFRTGPTVYLRPFTRTTLNVGGYYQQSWYEFSDSNEYLGATADINYVYSPLTNFDMYLSEVHFLPEGNSFRNQVNRNAGWRMNRRLQRGGWFVGAGMSQVVVDGVQTTDDAEEFIPTYLAGFSYQLTRNWRMGFTAEREVITIGEDALNAPERDLLLRSIDSGQLGSTTSSTPLDLASIRAEVDEFQYASGFNVNDAVTLDFNWSQGQWGAWMSFYARRVEVPQFQLDLSQEARLLLFPNAIVDAGQDIYGVSWTVSLEPKPRWLVDTGLSLENRDLRSLDVLAPSPTEDDISVEELREIRISTDITFAATRYLSFGGRFESALLQDRNGQADDVRSNRIVMMVEYSL